MKIMLKNKICCNLSSIKTYNPEVSRYRILGKRICRGMRAKAKDYCESTTLHGFSYIAKGSSPSYKSVFWSIVCMSSIAFCTLFIYFQLLRYQSNRVTTTITTTNYPIWDVPFPAVTVCNFNVVYKDHAEQFIKMLSRHNIADNVIQDYFLNLSAIILNDELEAVNWKAYRHITDTLRGEGYDTEKLMEALAQPCSSMIQQCHWKKEVIDCEDIFHTIKTTGGFCCSFNYRGVDAKLDNTKNSDWSVTGIGPNYGLEVYLNAEESQYMSSTKLNFGHSVLIHDPHEYPDIWLYSVNLIPGNKVSYGIKPVLISSKEEIRIIDISTRGCIFDDERKLLWTKYYTFNTCLTQCKVQAIREMCGCIPFYYPTKTVRFCTIMDSICLESAEKMFTNLRVINTEERYHLNNRFVCNCKHQCNEVNYEHTTEFEQLTPMVGSDASLVNSSAVAVYFSSVGSTQFTRSEYLTWDSLLASIGGIFGLFMGGSIVSIIEFFYHIVIWALDNQNIFKARPNRNKSAKHEAKIYVSELYPKGYLKQ